VLSELYVANGGTHQLILSTRRKQVVSSPQPHRYYSVSLLLFRAFILFAAAALILLVFGHSDEAHCPKVQRPQRREQGFGSQLPSIRVRITILASVHKLVEVHDGRALELGFGMRVLQGVGSIALGRVAEDLELLGELGDLLFEVEDDIVLIQQVLVELVALVHLLLIDVHPLLPLHHELVLQTLDLLLALRLVVTHVDLHLLQLAP